MTTRKSAAVAFHFRRSLLVFGNHSSSSVTSAPYVLSDSISQGRQCDSSWGCRRHHVLPRTTEVPIYNFSRVVIHSSPLLPLSGREIEQGTGPVWVSNIIKAVSQPGQGQRICYSEPYEPRGDNVWVPVKEEPNVAGSGSPLLQRLDISRHQSNRFALSTRFVGNQAHCHHLVTIRHHSLLSVVEGGRWMRITGSYFGPLASSACLHHPFLDGGVRHKSKKKIKRAKAKKKEILSKIKRMRVASVKRKEDMTHEESLEFRLHKGKKKIELIKVAIAKFPVQEIPPADKDIEVLTPEQLHYLRKIGYKNRNYVPVGRRGIYGGTIQNIHLHWKKHETVQVDIAGFTLEEIKVMADQLARLSGGLVIDIHQGNIVILYRGRNYEQPKQLIPLNTLDKRKALMKSKLEQSMKALEENQEKVKKLLDAHREDLARMRRGEPPPSRRQEINNSGKERWPAQSLEPEDPDEYSEWSQSEDSEDDGPICALEDPGDDPDWSYPSASKYDFPSHPEDDETPLILEDSSSFADLESEDSDGPLDHEECKSASGLQDEDNDTSLVLEESNSPSDLEDEDNDAQLVHKESMSLDLDDKDNGTSLVHEKNNSPSDPEDFSDLEDIQDGEGIFVQDNKAVVK